MKTFILSLLFINLASAAPVVKGRDLTEAQLTESSCGALALSQTQALSKNVSQAKVPATPVFDTKADAEIHAAIADLELKSKSYSADTPDSILTKPFLRTFNAVRTHAFGKECVALFQPVMKKCFSSYQTGSREEAHTCSKSMDEKKVKALLDKHFLKKK